MQRIVPHSDDREQVELYVSCKKLKNTDLMSRSDPQVRLYIQNTSNTWSFFSETEIIKNDLNPNFKTTFLVDFIFETNQWIKFEVVDHDDKGSSEIIGSVETTIGTIMGARKQTWVKKLKHDDEKTGKIIVKGDKVDLKCQSVAWQWVGVKLKNMHGCFGKNEPFLRFLKKKVSGDYLLVYETEVIEHLNPIWKRFKITDKKLGTDHFQDFKVECWDRRSNGKHKLIGQFETNLDKIKSGVAEFELYDPKNNANTGTLNVTGFTISPHVTFIDYLRGGTQLNIAVAIDFTVSNGDPKNNDSLHRFSKNPPNQYSQAISSICPIVLNYASDQLVPLYGFGGEPTWRMPQETSHCFPLAGDDVSEEVKGVEGILETYYKCLGTVLMSSPTHFASIIRKVNEKCKEIKDAGSDQYLVLLILTDGEIVDMPETIEEIIKASELPLSIIIVGVGNRLY